MKHNDWDDIARLEQRGMHIEEIRKIQYPWATELHDPPKWMKKPRPWDWLLVARQP